MIDLDLAAVRAFLAAVDEQQFSLAADLLGISQRDLQAHCEAGTPSWALRCSTAIGPGSRQRRPVPGCCHMPEHFWSPRTPPSQPSVTTPGRYGW